MATSPATPPSYHPHSLDELQSLIIEWGASKGLLARSKEQALAQHGKTEEEIEELKKAIAAFKAFGSYSNLKEVRLEAGDVLVTLVLQAEIQGLSFADCLGGPNQPVDGARLAFFANRLKDQINRERVAAQHISSVAHRLEWLVAPWNLEPVDCLEAAWCKIRDRTGRTVGGVFIKD